MQDRIERLEQQVNSTKFATKKELTSFKKDVD